MAILSRDGATETKFMVLYAKTEAVAGVPTNFHAVVVPAD